MKNLSFEQKRDVVLRAVVGLNQKFNQDFVVQEEFLRFGERDNAWLLVLSNYDGDKFYFSVFQWEIKGDFIKRISEKKNPFLPCISQIPSNIVEANIYDEGVVVFKDSNREYFVFNFAGESVLKTSIYPEVQRHLNFMEEVSVMRGCGVCWRYLGNFFKVLLFLLLDFFFVNYRYELYLFFKYFNGENF